MIRDRSHLALDPTKKRGRFGTTASEILSPVDKNMMDFVCSLISPDRFRGNIDLQGLQVFAQTQNEILETPTPTKVIFPKSVTKDQESFAEGFQQALKQLQQQNSFVPTPTNRNLPTIYNILAAITPTLPPQNPLIPSSSASLESPLTSEADTKTSETLTLSPTAVVTSSISPLSNESGGSLINTSTCSSTSSTSGVNLAEVQRKLTGTQNYMDIFQQSDLSGFSNFIGHHPNNLIPPTHLPPQLHSQPVVSQHAQPNGYPMSTTAQVKSDPQLSAAVSTLAAAAAMNSYGTQMHQNPVQPQRHTSGGPQRHLNAPSTSSDLMGYQNESLDLDEQERRKLERKRARNRMAASKCRQRKLERIQELEIQLQQEREKNVHLISRAEFMRNRVEDLTKIVEQHRQSGCALELPHWYRSPPLQHDMNM